MRRLSVAAIAGRWSSGGGLSKGGASQPRLPLGGQFSLRVFVCLIVIVILIIKHINTMPGRGVTGILASSYIRIPGPRLLVIHLDASDPTTLFQDAAGTLTRLLFEELLQFAFV